MGGIFVSNVKSRNYTLDLLKGICAVLVVFIHAKFPTNIGEFIVVFSGMAVPIFFLTSGFFLRILIGQKF